MSKRASLITTGTLAVLLIASNLVWLDVVADLVGHSYTSQMHHEDRRLWIGP